MKECKNYIFYFSLLLARIICIQSSVAQTIPYLNELKSSQLQTFGKNAVKLGDIYSGIELYSRYMTLNPTDIESAYILAELYRESRDYEQAKDWYLKVYEIDSEKYSMALFYYAKMLKMCGQYEDADTNFLRFKKEQRGAEMDIKKMLKNEMAGCNISKDIIVKNIEDQIFEVNHLNVSINKPHIESAPLLLDSTKLLYTALKADSIPVHKPNQGPVRKLYTAFKDEGDWYTLGEYKGPFNMEGVNTGNGALSPEGTRFYFTRCDAKAGQKTLCQIYVSEYDKGMWLDPILLEINDPEYTNTQPTVGKTSKEREVIYFISDRPGGRGGLDIWYSVYDRRKDSYGSVKNIGSKLNTIGDETTPFVHWESNSLYFSSDGWPSIGGLDIFKTSGAETRWLPPTNMGYPINSSADDLYLTINQNNEREGFFVSNRKGGTSLKSETCCDDIYSFKQKGSKIVTLMGKLYDVDYVEKILEMGDDFESIEKSVDNSRLLISDQIISVYEVAGDGEERILIKELNTNKKGEFSIAVERNKRFEIVAKRKGYFNMYHEFVTKGITGETLSQNLGLLILTKDPIVVKNIYYPYNESYLTEEAKESIDTSLYKILVQNPSIIIEILSHTDNHGAEEYNRKLSQGRAESVVAYLIEKGINKKRLSSKGFGELVPIARNENTDGSDNPDGRAMNRRTEFRVVGTLDKETEIIYSK